MQERIDDDDSHLSSTDLVKRIDNWLDRLSQLRQTVERWIQERAELDLRLEDAPAVPMREYLMQVHHIQERSMPAFKIMKGSQQLALFRPVGLWVVGANGRVDVFTAKAAPILVDSAAEFEKPAWKLYMNKSPRNAIEFNKESFYKVLELP